MAIAQLMQLVLVGIVIWESMVSR